MAAPRASETVVVVVAGGDRVDRAVTASVPPGAVVIAADSGVDAAHALGLRVDVAIGDFDSVTPEGLARARAEGAEVVRHPVDKDATDLELALDAALARGPDRIHVLGGAGGRLDHLLANLLVITSSAYAEVAVTAEVAGARLTVIRAVADLHGQSGDLVSLVPQHGPATGITTTGLAFPLLDETLEAGSSRGVSNRFVTSRATVAVASGVLLAVQPASPDHLPEEEPA